MACNTSAAAVAETMMQWLPTSSADFRLLTARR